jgi:heat shock protein HtpX
VTEIRKRHRDHFVRTGALLLAMVTVLVLTGWLLGGPAGVAWTLAAAVLVAALGPTLHPSRLLRAQGARPLFRGEASWLQAAVTELGGRAGLPQVPRLYLVPAPMPQAFATEGAGELAIGVTGALFRVLERDEAVAVVAHEVSHLQHRDLWTSRLTHALRSLTRSMSFAGLLLLFLTLPLRWAAGVHVPLSAVLLLLAAPWAAGLLDLAVSRSRELGADVGAVRLGADPRALARALWKLERLTPWWMRVLEVPAAFRTHPPTEERIEALLAIDRDLRAGVAPRRAGTAAPSRTARGVIVPEWRRPRVEW